MKRILPILIVCQLISVMPGSAMALSFTSAYDFTKTDDLDHSGMQRGYPFSRLNPIRFDWNHHPFFWELDKGHKPFSIFPDFPGSLSKREGVKNSLAHLWRDYPSNSSGLNGSAGENTSGTSPVPEPSSLILMGVGLSALAYARRKGAFPAKGQSLPIGR